MMSANHHTLLETARVFEDVTNSEVNDDIISVFRDNLSDTEKADIYKRYDNGNISEQAAKHLLGNTAFTIADTTTTDTQELLDSDTNRYIAD